jgi:hypothetical protein
MKKNEQKQLAIMLKLFAPIMDFFLLNYLLPTSLGV